MGRYDKIKLDYPIPNHLREPISMAIQADLNHLAYQTKDFDGGYFEDYRIDEDGLLYKGHDRFDDAHAIPKWYFCSTYSGQFNIYAYFYANAYALEKSYKEFKLKVIQGKIEKLKLHKLDYNNSGKLV